MGYDFVVMRETMELPPDYEPMFPEEPRLYQLNVWGMAAVLRIMSLAGIIDSEATHDEWPKWPPDGIGAKRADALAEHVFRQAHIFPPARRWEIERVRECGAISDAIRGSRSSRPGLVPGYKFKSNNGWLVYPDECLVIADRLEQALAVNPTSILPNPAESGIDYEEATTRVRSWSLYNRFAAINDGYQVW